MPAWSAKPGMLRPGVVGMRVSMVIRLRPCMIMSTAPLPPQKRTDFEKKGKSFNLGLSQVLFRNNIEENSESNG